MDKKTANDFYREAIAWWCSPGAAQYALDKGADVDASVSPPGCYYGHALKELICDQLPSLLNNDGREKRIFPPDRLTDTIKGIQVVLNAGPNLEIKNEVTGATMLDDIISGGRSDHLRDPRWLEPAADTVIHTLHDNVRKNAAVYSIDFDSIFAFLGGFARRDAMDSIEAVHNRVRDRLNAPRIEQEKLLHKNPRVSFWLTPFDRPDTEFLAKPSMAMVKSKRLMQMSGGPQSPHFAEALKLREAVHHRVMDKIKKEKERTPS